ncbi:hypothetical protein vseg_016491 [Gypsophila vaccaria]
MAGIKEILKKKRLMSIILGQFLSVVITSTGFTSSELARKGVNAPTSQSFLNYVLLAIVYGSVMFLKKQRLKAKWYYYVILGLIDVEANFLVVKAYQYTSLTSIMLLDCWAIPCVIILTWLFLKTKYGWRKFLGVAICIAGIVLIVFSDVNAEVRKEGGSDPLKGDMLVLAGATLYGVANVSEEFLVKNADKVELMAFLGVFGAIISAIQIAIVERTELKAIHWSAGAALPFAGFAVAMFLFYSLVPVLLQMSGSTMLNLSLLSSDMWAVLISVFAYHQKVDWMYYLAFASVAVGLVIYSWGDKVEEKKRAREAEKTGEGSRRHDEEGGVQSSDRDVGADSFRRGPDNDVEPRNDSSPNPDIATDSFRRGPNNDVQPRNDSGSIVS